MEEHALEPANDPHPQAGLNPSADLDALQSMQMCIDCAPVAIFRLGDAGNIFYANRQACADLGYTRQELMGLTIFDIDVSINREVWIEHRKSLREIGSRTVESVHRRKDGSLFPVEVVINSYLYQGEQQSTSFVTDISERKKSLENTQRLQRLEVEAMQVARLGYWEYDTASELFTFSDPYFALHGTTAQQAGGYRMTAQAFARQYVHPEDAHLVQDAIQLALQARDPQFHFQAETRILKADGSTADVNVWFRIEKDQTGKTVKLFGVNQEISERKRVETALRESEFFLRKSQEVGGLGSYLFDARTGAWISSEKLDQLFGIDANYPKTIQGWVDMIHPDHRPEMLPYLVEDVLIRHQRFDREYRIVRQKDGEARWVHGLGELEFDAAGNTLRMIGTIQDITQRKQYEEALRSSEERQRLVLEATSDAIWDWDLRTNQLYFSPRYYTMLGYEPGEFEASLENWRELLHPENRDSAVRMVQQVIEQGGGFSAEFRMKMKDGSWCWIFARGKAVLRDQNGRALRLAGSNSDITERKSAEISLQQSEARVRQLNEELEKRVSERTAQLQNANRELEAFAYSVSHDLRAPLRAINGYTRMLLEDYEATLDEEGKRICGVISEEGQRMGQLIDELLEFSRLGRTEISKVPVDMDALVTSVFRDLTANEDLSRIKFEKTGLASVVADPILLRQVWQNLFSNALKFSRDCQVAEIEVGCRKENTAIIYWVQDNGAGFDMRYQDKLFGVFQRLHSASEFEGTGVGLAIVQRIIHRHGGDVWAVGKVGQGATFSFSLPRKGNQA